MKTDYIALSIPAFFLLIGVEFAIAKRRGLKLYSAADTIADIGCGVVQQVAAIFFVFIIAGGYKWIFDHWRFFTIPEDSILAGIALFFGVDFFYYWFHRLSHEHNFMWAAHVVHHQSEEYNLAVALRQSAIQPLISWLFYIPLALVGFPPLMFASMAAFSTLYQFWIHTRLINRLGPLEWFLNTPSHHRVHHGRNPEYIDKNHGATLIIWDRLFGSFIEEKAEVIYGVTEPVASWNPVFANVHYWRDLWADAKRGTFLEMMKLLLQQPGSRPASDRTPLKRSIELDAPKYAIEISNGTLLYVAVQFLIVLAGAVFLIFQKSKLGDAATFALAACVVAGFYSVGALLDGRRYVRFFEPVRILGTLVVVAQLLR